VFVAKAEQIEGSLGASLKKIDAYQFFRLGAAIHPITSFPNGAQLEVKVLFFALSRARTIISFVHAALPPSSEQAANVLLAQIAICGDGLEELDSDTQVQIPELTDLVQKAKDFERVLANDLPKMDTYQVLSKGLYAIPALIESAELAIIDGLSGSAQGMIPSETLLDFNQAGRCIALQLPTASGFHTMRSVEAVIEKYWKVVSHTPSSVHPPDVLQCITELRTAGEDKKLMLLLDRICRELNRETLVDQAAFLQARDALLLFDISKSAICAMAERMEELASAASTSLPLRRKPPLLDQTSNPSALKPGIVRLKG